MNSELHQLTESSAQWLFQSHIKEIRDLLPILARAAAAAQALSLLSRECAPFEPALQRAISLIADLEQVLQLAPAATALESHELSTLNHTPAE